MIKIQELINNIVIKEKEGIYYYNFIKFDIKMWKSYIDNIALNLDKLKLIRIYLLYVKKLIEI